MKILITGASGYLGNKLAHTVANRGHEVHALVRNDAAKDLLRHSRIKIFKGDVLNKQSVSDAMKGCAQVFHTAAKVGAWADDRSVFYAVNVEGTRNVLDEALNTGVDKIVCTSSCGVIGPTLHGPLNEDAERTSDFDIDYDLSKKRAEDLIMQYVNLGLNVSIVSPSKVYGPGNISHSLTANAIIESFLKKNIALIPSPGNYEVCFAYIDDIIYGHVLAMEKAKRGEKYILGGINISYFEFFDHIRAIANSRGKIIRVPKKIIQAWAYLQEMNHKLWNSPVRFTVKSVNHLFSNYTFSSDKAIKQLGYSITPLDKALTTTIHFLKNKRT
jgi:nucleoside-diphosphate-sugar epimerase